MQHPQLRAGIMLALLTLPVLASAALSSSSLWRTGTSANSGLSQSSRHTSSTEGVSSAAWSSRAAKKPTVVCVR